MSARRGKNQIPHLTMQTQLSQSRLLSTYTQSRTGGIYICFRGGVRWPSKLGTGIASHMHMSSLWTMLRIRKYPHTRHRKKITGGLFCVYGGKNNRNNDTRDSESILYEHEKWVCVLRTGHGSISDLVSVLALVSVLTLVSGRVWRLYVILSHQSSPDTSMCTCES